MFRLAGDAGVAWYIEYLTRVIESIQETVNEMNKIKSGLFSSSNVLIQA